MIVQKPDLPSAFTCRSLAHTFPMIDCFAWRTDLLSQETYSPSLSRNLLGVSKPSDSSLSPPRPPRTPQPPWALCYHQEWRRPLRRGPFRYFKSPRSVLTVLECHNLCSIQTGVFITGSTIWRICSCPSKKTKYEFLFHFYCREF
jgi:hypothetical protein